MIIGGAELLESPTDPYVRDATYLSADGATLILVSKGPQGRYRVEPLERYKDSYYRGGEGWRGTGDASITDSAEAAEQLARAYLAG